MMKKKKKAKDAEDEEDCNALPNGREHHRYTTSAACMEAINHSLHDPSSERGSRSLQADHDAERRAEDHVLRSNPRAPSKN